MVDQVISINISQFIVECFFTLVIERMIMKFKICIDNYLKINEKQLHYFFIILAVLYTADAQSVAWEPTRLFCSFSLALGHVCIFATGEMLSIMAAQTHFL